MVVVRSLVVAATVGWLFERMKVPAGALLGAMVGVAAMNLLRVEATGSGNVLRFAAFVVLGWELGSRISADTLAAVREAAVPIVVVVFGLLLASAALAWVLHASGLDSATAFLAASPGGLSQMVAISSELGANVVVVSVVHLLRIVGVVAIAPLVARLLSG